jgi:hypothetical protein
MRIYQFGFVRPQENRIWIKRISVFSFPEAPLKDVPG